MSCLNGCNEHSAIEGTKQYFFLKIFGQDKQNTTVNYYQSLESNRLRELHSSFSRDARTTIARRDASDSFRLPTAHSPQNSLVRDEKKKHRTNTFTQANKKQETKPKKKQLTFILQVLRNHSQNVLSSQTRGERQKFDSNQTQRSDKQNLRSPL